ncbi:HAMP domain-containing sensor histidine kinase [Nesterenkonia sp. F]|uniref:sensor histidine kinase n=1 Tax=Nesterenkonia sp. F TaxID=795955 RepID=UPI001ED8D634|nr:HAMP domain-containing sensor histidine kinase [Nesterenkonia sp. F]
MPPSEQSLQLLLNAAGEDAMVVHDDLVVAAGVLAARPGTVPESFRESVQSRAAKDDPRMVTRRVEIDGAPWLLLGTPVTHTTPGGERRATDVEVYAARDLSAIDEQLDQLVAAAAGTAALVLPLAVVVALLASGSVLKPVAKLRTTARRLADGDLAARTEPRGVDELAQLTRTVDEMAAALQESMESMARMQQDARRFAADVSHELRTPLTTLTAAVEVLHAALDERPSSAEGASGHSAEDDEVRESAELAIEETRRLVQLVEDIMEIARFDASTATMRWEETDVVAAVADCLRTRSWAGQVHVVGPGSPEASDEMVVMADRGRLDMVLANLVGNALRHGGAPVQVTVVSAPGEVSVEVLDGGPGIPESVLPHIFSRFYKADGARSRTVGSGLGLAIAQENAHLHGGQLTAENVDDGARGARFTLRLPRDGRGVVRAGDGASTGEPSGEES